MSEKFRTPAIRLAACLPLCALMALSLGGCGQKGPLYEPGDSQSAKAYDPQGAYEERGTTGQNGSSGSATPSGAGTPQSIPMPAAQQPNAEELP